MQMTSFKDRMAIVMIVGERQGKGALDNQKNGLKGTNTLAWEF